MRHMVFLRSVLVGVTMSATLLSGASHASPSLLFELQSGKVLAHEDAFKRWYPASLTKLMTAYVTFRAVAAGELQLDSPIKVTKHSAAEPPSKMGFKPGSVMTLDNALKMMLIKSANDIAMAVGENVGGSEQAFVMRMNEEARRLGMSGSHFVNPNGLHSPDQYTTARDLGLLVTAIRTEFPQYAPYFAIEGLQAGKKALYSYNLLVGRFPGAEGMKTGFVCPSGFNMIGSATRGGRTLVAVVLGQKSGVVRAEAAAALLETGFSGIAAPTGTLRALPSYGDTQSATDMREDVCGKKHAVAAQSEEAVEDKNAPKSPYLEKLDHPATLALVGLGGATGPVPKAWAAAEAAGQTSEIPIPTPRPADGPKTAKATEQGDSSPSGLF